jgi:hypothetical protein
MGRTYVKDNITTSSGVPFLIGTKAPLDVRTVLDSVEDLKDRAIATSAYIGLTVYIVEESSFYVCIKQARGALTDDNVWDYWKRVDVDYSVRIVDSESNLTDGTTIMFPYQGLMAYVTSESALYVLLTKGVENAKDINNWRKISAASSTSPAIDKVGIDVAPECGSGFKITSNNGVIIDDYVNVENYIKASYTYTSKGVNSFDTDSNFTYDLVRLSKGGESYIELYANGDNWMMVNDPDNSLGLSEISGKTFAKETPVSFGVDIKFTEGWTISYGDITREFVESDYELIDIYRSEYSPEVYAYLKDIDVRMLTEDDLVAIDEKIDNLAYSIMIDLGADSDIGESDSDVSEQVPLQKVIVQMNNSINKLEQTVVEVEPESIEHYDIEQLFS